jgi:hypothetical protein
MDQLNVEDCPRSMVAGSAVKTLITGFSPPLGLEFRLLLGVVVDGGVGATGVCFLHPAAQNTNASISRPAPIKETFNVLLSRILNQLLIVNE